MTEKRKYQGCVWTTWYEHKDTPTRWVKWLCSPPVREIVCSNPVRVKPKTVKLVFGASPLNTNKEQRMVGSVSKGSEMSTHGMSVVSVS